LAKLGKLNAEKRRVLDIYASGDLSREAYAEKSRQCDAEISELAEKRSDLAGRIPLLQTKDAVETAVTQHCEAVKARLDKCVDFNTKRQFLLDFVEKVTFWNDRITVHGSVPVREKISREAASAGACNLAFCIQGRITGAEHSVVRSCWRHIAWSQRSSYSFGTDV
jgi:hypothetical protein